MDFVTSVIGKPKPKPKTSEELEKEGVELPTIKTTITTIPPYDPAHPDRVGGRRRKSRRGKSRKYKRTLKRRKNKTKNRK